MPSTLRTRFRCKCLSDRRVLVPQPTQPHPQSIHRGGPITLLIFSMYLIPSYSELPPRHHHPIALVQVRQAGIELGLADVLSCTGRLRCGDLLQPDAAHVGWSRRWNRWMLVVGATPCPAIASPEIRGTVAGRHVVEWRRRRRRRRRRRWVRRRWWVRRVGQKPGTCHGSIVAVTTCRVHGCQLCRLTWKAKRRSGIDKNSEPGRQSVETTVEQLYAGSQYASSRRLVLRIVS
ncbi:hypothetical protein EDB80DRAFT_734619 [Ilyonectria destructans]|nr:hypothetical protein EDB80DRAFT_734619 [Ilyonectria destructans]